MKKRMVFFLLLLFPLLTTGCSATNKSTPTNAQPKKNESELIEGTFNVDIKAFEVSVAEQRKLLSDEHVEIFGIQEVIQNTKRYKERDGYDPLVDFKKAPYKSAFFGKSVDFAGGGYGNAIISSYSLSDESVVPLYSSEAAPEDLQAEFLEVHKCRL